MTDYTELKRLAEGAVHAGDHWGLRDSFERQLAKLVSPETILALIAENERIAKTSEAWERLSVYSKSISDSFRAERDQLKAENEALRSDIQSWRLSIEAERNVHKLSLKGVQDELDRLKGPGFAEELATLRKNTARYQWLREARSGYIEVVEWIGPHATGMTGEDLDALLDAVMSKGEQS